MLALLLLAHRTPSQVHAYGYIFDDEFSGSSLDITKWSAPSRMGDLDNSELECYQPANVTVSGGLNLTATYNTSGCTATGLPPWMVYPSGAVYATGFSFLYGRMDVRAKWGTGATNTDIWPTIWLLGHDCQQTWAVDTDVLPCDNHAWEPGHDEIDVCDFLSGDTTQCENAVHMAGGFAESIPMVNWSTAGGYHIYSVDWEPSAVTFYIDGTQTYTESGDIPASPMFPVIDVAVGGGGGTVTNGDLPLTSNITYVRVTQTAGTVLLPGTTTIGAGTISATLGFLVGSQFTAPLSQSVNQLACYILSSAALGTAATVNLALYTDSSGSPGTLVDSGTNTVVAADARGSPPAQPNPVTVNLVYGWNIVNLASSDALVSGTKYWIVENNYGTSPSINDMVYDQGAMNQSVWVYDPSSGFPATFPASSEVYTPTVLSCFAIWSP